MINLKRFSILAMLLAFLLLAFTGVVRVPETQKYFTFIYDFISASRLAFIHDWSGVVLVFLIALHLILKRRWFLKLLDTEEASYSLSSKVLLALSIAFLVGLGIFYFNHQTKNDSPVHLAPVEVREYKGEKLGSLDDFRENSIKGVQNIDKEKYTLVLDGLVNAPKKYTYAELLRFQSYEKVVQLNCVEGWSVKALWKGFLISDLLKDIQIKPEAKTVIFYAADGYSTSFPLTYFLDNNILLAYNLNGVELPSERGFPLQLVAEQKWGYKWIKWITRIELSDDENYKGFWESRGYNNNGNLSGSKFEQ